MKAIVVLMAVLNAAAVAADHSIAPILTIARLFVLLALKLNVTTAQ